MERMIGVQTARSAVTNLAGMDMYQIKNLSLTNRHIFQKHTSRSQAEPHSQNQPQGWFEKVKTVIVTTESDYKQLSKGRQGRLQTASGLSARNLTQALRRNDPLVPQEFTLGVTDDVGIDGMPALIHAALQQDYSLYRAEDDPDSRFLFVAHIPAGYVGRTIHAGSKTKLVGGLIIIVVQVVASMPQIITVYPVDVGWANRHSGHELG
jgi:hypothetical protein